MDELEGVYVSECTRSKVEEMEAEGTGNIFSNKRKRNDPSESADLTLEKEDITDSAKMRRTDFLTDIESQILPCDNKVPKPESSELRIKHIDQDCDKGDWLGGYIVTTKDAVTYHHVFNGLSQTGILYKDLQIRDGEVLLCINGVDTYNLTHEEVVGKFVSLDTREKQSFVTSNIEKGEVIQISFILVGYKPKKEGAVEVERTMAGIKSILKIRCKENYCYLSAETQQQPPTLFFQRINAGNRHTCHFIQKNVGGKQFSLRTELGRFFVGFEKGSSFDNAVLLQTEDSNYITDFDIKLNRNCQCFDIGFSDNNNYYFLQMDDTTPYGLVARRKYDRKLIAFSQRCTF